MLLHGVILTQITYLRQSPVKERNIQVTISPHEMLTDD